MPFETRRHDDPLGVASAARLAVFCFVFLGAVAFAIELRGTHDISIYFRDPASSFGFTPTAGLVSYLGILALFATASICIFASRHVLRDRSLLLAFGLFSAMLAMDDLFMFHETLARGWLGLSETHIMAIFAIIGLGLMFVHRASILGAAHAGFYIALSFLAASIAVDKFDPDIPFRIVFEDGFKFVGFILWSAYFIRRAGLAVGVLPASPPPVLDGQAMAAARPPSG